MTIYQVIDDASRFDVGTKAFASPENGTDARAVLAEAFATYGKPQEILSDNGDAFAAYHRGYISTTETWLASEGVLAIAGFAPTTQGKDERSHRTLTQFLDARHPVSLAEVNTYLAEYRHVYAAVPSLRSAGIKPAPVNAAISESLTGSPPVPSSGEPPLPDTHSGATRCSPHRYHFSLLNRATVRIRRKRICQIPTRNP
ncbi:hypothetical protein MHJ95_04055 [Corynebacterium imitans]|nr:hypothetical protein [Corynebacterium imitans]